jgi:hypothetical protein
LLPPLAKRILQYFERIDEAKGKAGRMDLLRIAGNEANLNRMVGYLIKRGLITEVKEGDIGRVSYCKTDLGEKLHALLKGHEYFGSLIEELGSSRLGPS